MLRQVSSRIAIRAAGPKLHEITREARDFVAGSGIAEGVLTLFCRHTSASLIIQENLADSIVSHSPTAIPGMLQTEDYVRALYELSGRYTTERLKILVQARLDGVRPGPSRQERSGLGALTGTENGEHEHHPCRRSGPEPTS